MRPARTPRSFGLLLAGGAALTVVAAAVGLVAGSSPVGIGDVLSVLGAKAGLVDATVDPVHEAIVWSLRLPRVLVALAVGASLALAGTLMQALFRNALASPDIIGTSAGAAFGAVCAITFGLSMRSLFYVPLAAAIGAILALIVVLRIAQRDGETTTATLLLSGVAMTAFLGAVNSWLIARSWEQWEVARRIAYWMMGGIADRTWAHVWIAWPPLVVVLALSLFSARELDLLLEGEEVAASLGVDVERLKRRALFLAAVITGSAVAVSGIVGFVGLVVPHMARLVVGPGHRRLIPFVTLTGCWFLVFADLVARNIAPPVEMQLGTVTAFVGAPFFVFLLLRHRREGGLL